MKIPNRFIPDGEVRIGGDESLLETMTNTDRYDPHAGLDPCPGCGREWHPTDREYRSRDYGADDETWCRECAFAERDDIERVGDSKRMRDQLDDDELERLKAQTESGRWQEAIEIADAENRPEGHGARFCPKCHNFGEWRPVDYDHPAQRLCAHCGQAFVGEIAEGLN